MTTSTTSRTNSRLSHPAGSSPVLRDLGAEWRRLSTADHAISRVNAWGLPNSPIQHLDEVLERAGFGRDHKDSIADHYLYLLVTRAASDELAARIVLQRLLPPLIAVARRRGKITVGGFDEALTEIISHAWTLIRTYPTERRPAKVASNLVRDSEYYAFVQPTRYRKYSVQLCDNETMAHVPAQLEDEDAKLILNDTLDRATSYLSSTSLSILRKLANGTTIEEIAKERGVRVRTARGWQQEAINELRARRRSVA